MQVDKLGREIKVRDIVAYSNSGYVSVQTGVVTKINPKTIQIGGSGAHDAKGLIIVTEQYGCSGKQAEADRMIRGAESRIDETRPAAKPPSQKWRYGIFVCFDTPDKIADISQCTVHIVKLKSDTDSQNSQSYREWYTKNPQFIGGDRNYYWSVTSGRWGGNIKMSQSSSYHQHDLKLMVVKELGLQSYIDTHMSYEAFKALVKGKLDFQSFDPMTAKQRYR